MSSLNKVQLIGNTTADPTIRMTQKGDKVASFSVATNRTWKNEAGEKVDAADFHQVVAFGKLAEIMETWVKKGMKIYIEGRLNTSSYMDKENRKVYRTEVFADQMIMLGSKGDNAPGARTASREDVKDLDAVIDTMTDFPETKTSIEDVPF